MQFRLGFVCAVVAVPTFSWAQILPVDQSRFVSALGSIRIPEDFTNDEQSDSAPDFSPFISSRAAHLSLGFSALDAEAQQNSSIAPSSVTMSGMADVAAKSGFSGEIAGGEGHSAFSLTFDLIQSEMWDLDATALGTASGNANGNAFLQLMQDVTTISALDSDNASNLHVSLLLPAGEYVLTAEANVLASASNGPSASSAHAEIDFDFHKVPEPSAFALLGVVGIFLGRHGRR